MIGEIDERILERGGGLDGQTIVGGARRGHVPHELLLKDADAVAKKLKELPLSDLYLFEVKKPSESKRDWDYYNLLATVPGDTAYPTAASSGCPLTK
jgi:hypothetical protein